MTLESGEQHADRWRDRRHLAGDRCDASYQRGYFTQSEVNCAAFGTVLVTIVVGPLNYLGVNPRIECEVPQPSQ
ncbi:hypothetical protein ACQPZA_01035 [Pseudonocardia xinjiangensis]|uniref:hypothetical protein n=1 Tax=Pseudonocardia xinjiangensis TaxID=75289 RepID=UPI003D8E6101